MAQTLKLHQVNMIEATEFCQKHNFEISQEILDLVDEIGEISNQVNQSITMQRNELVKADQQISEIHQNTESAAE